MAGNVGGIEGRTSERIDRLGSGDFTGETWEVRPVRVLRPERRFESPEALRAQIDADLRALADAVSRGEV